MSVIKKAIYTKLTGTTALTSLLASTTAIYDTQAPDSADYPYVVISLYAGGNENLTPSESINQVYYIRAYATGKMSDAEAIDDQIKAALHKQTLTVTGYTNFWTAREQDLQGIENPPSEQKVFMAGGLYRIRIDL